MLPKVSVIIPTYNQSNFIKKSVESALAQNYVNFEVIISDDCSTDSTELVLVDLLYNEKVKYFRNKKNLGRVGNYKHALEKYATGDWVVNLDGDDYFCDNNFLSEVIDIVVRQTAERIAFVQGGQYISKNGLLILDNPAISSEILLMDGKEYFYNFRKFNHFSHLSTVFNRKKAVEIDFYRLDISSSDIESFLRLALHGQVILIKKPYGVWQHHQTNFSQNLNFKLVMTNFKYIDSVYRYARKQGLNTMRLFFWKIRQQLFFIRRYSNLNTLSIFLNQTRERKKSI